MRHPSLPRVAWLGPGLRAAGLALALAFALPPATPAQEERESENADVDREAAEQSRRERRRAEREAAREEGGAERRRAPDRGGQTGARQGQGESGGGFVTSDSLDAMADPDMVVLYFDPPSVTAVAGQTFETTLTLSNPRNRPFDRLQIAVRYNDAVVNPIGRTLGPALAGEEERFEIRHFPERGLALIDAQFPAPRTDARLEILDILWEARREIDTAYLDFPSGELFRNFVGTVDGGNVLGSPVRGEASGLIAAEIRILPGLPIVGEGASGEITLPWERAGAEPDARDHGVEMALMPRGVDAATGALEVDILLHNPEGAFADDVALLVRFDPDALEVVDAHRDNWIENGVNIWDGPYHERYPFDLHLENRVDNQLGTIRYRMGFFEPSPLSSGTLATIRLLPRRAGEQTRLFFDPERTAVRSMGFDVLGNPETGEIGLHSTVLTIPRHLADVADPMAADPR